MGHRLPLCSSDEIIKALMRDGFRYGTVKSGSHHSLSKTLADGRTVTTVVVLGEARGAKRYAAKYSETRSSV